MGCPSETSLPRLCANKTHSFVLQNYIKVSSYTIAFSPCVQTKLKGFLKPLACAHIPSECVPVSGKALLWELVSCQLGQESTSKHMQQNPWVSGQTQSLHNVPPNTSPDNTEKQTFPEGLGL
eukprot:6492614-Amphidinium_carterae.1